MFLGKYQWCDKGFRVCQGDISFVIKRKNDTREYMREG